VGRRAMVGRVGDQHAGHGAVAGQSAAGLGRQRPGPANLTPQGACAAEQAVQVHGDRQLGPDPTGLGQPPAFQGPAGMAPLGLGVGAVRVGHQPQMLDDPA
jgi:hypothetical protein